MSGVEGLGGLGVVRGVLLGSGFGDLTLGVVLGAFSPTGAASNSMLLLAKNISS